ncbi:ankyrin repeat domain-containing protein [Candidatus Dependentiae bacterium]|nr:ankyrin repeat domain-containing protein [Candidatus Dependentiae bacterium]
MNLKKILVISLLSIVQSVISTQEDLNRLYLLVDRVDVKQIKQILDQGFDVNTQDQKNHQTLLHYVIFRAARIAHGGVFIPIVDLLLKKGANPDIKNIDDLSAYDLAREVGNINILTLLWRHRHDKELIQQKTPEIFKAIENSDYDAIKKLAQEVSFIYVADANGNNPLHKAVSTGDKKMVGYILSIQPELARLRNNRGETPVDLAANKPAILAEFIKLGYLKK